MMRFWAVVVPIVALSGSVSAQRVSDESATEIMESITQTLDNVHSCSYRTEMHTTPFGSDTFDTRSFSVHFRRNTDNALYGYDWEISEHKKDFTFTFMIMPASWIRIHSGTRGISYHSLLKRFEPGSFYWTMWSYFIMDEVLAPFNDVPIAELSVVDSAGYYWISRQMNDHASDELVVRKETLLPVKSASIIKDNTLDLVLTIAVEFQYTDPEMQLADTAFSPDYYISKGYELNITEEDAPPVEYTAPDPEVNPEFLLTYPLASADGDTVILDESNSAYILLDFWYASCLPCIQAMPQISQLAGEYSEQSLQVYGVNCFDMAIKSALTSKLKAKDIDMPLLYGSRDLTDALGIRSFPRYVLIAPDSQVQFIDGGVQGVREVLTELFGK
jgi:thiol-disulfide isomerase/thioredoxin